jgi:molecular chaperone DnaK (HSP70)
MDSKFDHEGGAMTQLAGLDINASRARSMAGPGKSAPRPVPLEGDSCLDLPLALSLEGRRIEIGSSAVQLCRRFPHLVCAGFLPHLGRDRHWQAGRHRLDAAAALGYVLKHLRSILSDVQALALTFPDYLDRKQRALLADLFKQAKLPVVGKVTAPLAAAWAAREQRPWFGQALILDIDDHAFCCSAVVVDEPPCPLQARLVVHHTVPALGMRTWTDRLLNSVADRCVRQSRRDPRSSGTTEQLLYEQLDRALDSCRNGQLVELVIQADNWYHDMLIRPAEVESWCAPLVRRGIRAIGQVLRAAAAEQPPVLVVATAAVSRLPGLLSAVGQQTGPQTRLLILDDDAIPRTTFELAGRFHDGTLEPGFIDTVVPLKKTARPAPRTLSKTEPMIFHSRVGQRIHRPPRSDDDFHRHR